MTDNKKPIIGISMGDPAGIGPEVILKAFRDGALNRFCLPIILGNANVFEKISTELNLPISIQALRKIEEYEEAEGTLPVLDIVSFDHNDFAYGTTTEKCGEASYQSVVKAVEYCISKKIDGLVTAPIRKKSWHLAGHHFDGHTGLLAHLTKTENYRMLFVSKKLNTILVTTHVSLRNACGMIKKDRVLETIVLGNNHLKQMGYTSPRIAVCGLNPHAGEDDLFGEEDSKEIGVAVKEALLLGINARGPFPADTIFLSATQGEYDLVVAQYHDQGLIPVKLLAFETAVNVTVGLPIVRTSVDHGTAFDIAGKGVADHKNLFFALRHAATLLS
jgi:4-hydroxythreonine-4-phosphate dehydrogenase